MQIVTAKLDIDIDIDLFRKMSVTLHVTILNDGDLIEKDIEVSSDERVGIIPEMLGLALSKGDSLKILKQCTDLGYDDIIGEVFQPDDIVDVFNVRENSEEERARRFERKSHFFNDSDDEIILVVRNFRSQRPIFIPGHLVQSVTFSASNFLNKVELYRKIKNETHNGEAMYRGLLYKLPTVSFNHEENIYLHLLLKADNILEYYINNEGLNIIVRRDNIPKLIPHEGEIIKYERDFYRPTGKKLTVMIENTGLQLTTK